MNAPSNKDRYLVEGNLPLGLWKFAIPFMGAFLLQALYGAVDLFVIGQYCDRGAVAAVGIGAQFMQLVLGSLFGLLMGTTVLIGFNIGAKDNEGLANAIGSTATLFLLGAMIFTPLAACFTHTIVETMQTPEEAAHYAYQYIFICACGLPFIIGYNVVGAIYRGMGDSLTPTLFVAIACVFNMVGDFILIGGLHLGPAGAAYATVSAQALSFFYALAHMRRRRFGFEFHRRNFILRRKPVVAIFKVGLPIMLQNILTDISFIVIFAIVNLMGVNASAGLAVASRVIVFLLLPPISFSSAVSTAAAQNFGAKKCRRAFNAFLYGMSFSLVFGVLFWTLCQFSPMLLTNIFTKDELVSEHAAAYLRSFTLDCILVSFIFNFNGYFCGCGRALFTSTHTIIAALGARMPLSYFFSRLPNATTKTVGFAAPLATLLSVVLCILYFLILYTTGKIDLKDHDEAEQELQVSEECQHA